MGAPMTLTSVAEIELEAEPRDGGYDVEGNSGYNEGYTLMVRPRGVRLDNDGVYHYWIDVVHTWTLTYDGVGWRATSDNPKSSTKDHICRLADAAAPKGSFVSSLPTTAGRYELDPARVYTLQLGASVHGGLTLSVLD